VDISQDETKGKGFNEESVIAQPKIVSQMETLAEGTDQLRILS
jgi:hypothetical protein